MRNKLAKEEDRSKSILAPDDSQNKLKETLLTINKLKLEENSHLLDKQYSPPEQETQRSLMNFLNGSISNLDSSQIERDRLMPLETQQVYKEMRKSLGKQSAGRSARST